MKFGILEFAIENNQVGLVSHGDFFTSPQGFAEVQIVGENKGKLGIKAVNSSESKKLSYVSHEIVGDTLIITQSTDKVQVQTYFQGFENTNALRIYTQVKNVSEQDVVLEDVSAFILKGLFGKMIYDAKELRFTKFIQSHHAECQARTNSFFELGMHRGNEQSQRRICFANIGSQSTKEALPQGIIQDESGNALMFQIESNHSWYYEIADFEGKYYLYLGTANLHNCAFAKRLQKGETYTTVNVALSFGKSTSEAINEMTKYRRQITVLCESDKDLPIIFNEYIYLCWDSPSAENTKRIAPIAKKAGAEVISGSSRMKGGNAQKFVLNMLFTCAMVKSGYVYENLMINLKPSNIKLKNRMIGIVRDILSCDEKQAERLLEKNDWNIKKCVN